MVVVHLVIEMDELLRVLIRFHPHPHPDQNSHHDVTCIPKLRQIHIQPSIISLADHVLVGHQ